MEKFNHINQLHNVAHTIKHYSEKIGATTLPTLKFIGTVKLHGTNCSISRTNMIFAAHSKSRTLSYHDDHCGFAKFVDSVGTDRLNGLINNIYPTPKPEDTVVLYGEFIGPGIQKHMAINKLDEKQFVIFAAKVNGDYIQLTNRMQIELPECNVYSVQFGERFIVTIDFNNPAAGVEDVNVRTMRVDAECPWGKRFGITGVGEGIVWQSTERMMDTGLWFKSKGPSHENVRNSSKPASIDPEVVESINKCVDLVLGRGRLEQGLNVLTEMNLEHDIRSLGQYLKWINADILREEIDVIKTNELDWKLISKEITKRSKTFFIESISII